MDLSKLLNPRSIAIVGASEKYGLGSDTCRNAIDCCRDLSRVYFVHPKYSTVFGRTCYPSVSEIPDTLDLVVMCTNQKTVIPTMREAAGKGCRAAVVYASGYSEMRTAESIRAEEELIAAAKELDMAVMGPNCGGFVNMTEGVCGFAFQAPMQGKSGGIGFFSQSGQICINMLNCPELRFSLVISGGNCRIVHPEDYLDYLVEDENTRVIAMYLEGVKEPAAFIRVLRKAALRRKPVVVLKMGRSPKGQATAASHTGSLAGSDSSFDAIFRKFGVIRVDDMQDLRSTAALLSTMKTLPQGTRFASINLSGGETGICADNGFLAGIDYPDLDPETVEKLRRVLPPYAGFGNPLDMTTMPSYDKEQLANAIQIVMDDPGVDLGFIGWTIREDSVGSFADNMLSGIREACVRVPDKPLCVMSFMEYTRNRAILNDLADAGVSVLPSTKYAFSALKHLSAFVAYDPRQHTLDVSVPSRATGKGVKRPCSEWESRRILQSSGVEMDMGYLAASRAEARELAKAMTFPIAMKIASEDILHKSDVGGVRLNVSSPDEVEELFDELIVSAKAHCPDARIDGVLMQRMLPRGTELIIGVQVDEQFGPMILAGLGGVFVEVFRDAAIYPAPLSENEAMDMLSSLRSARLLKGYRGNKPLDLEAAAKLLVQISDFAVQHRDTLRELDLNPVFIYPRGQGVAIADALIIQEEQTTREEERK